jgi:protein gp37
MSAVTSISWTTSTWNTVTGCEDVSDGCLNCYARTFSERFRGVAGHYFENGFDVTLRPDRLDLPFRWKKPRRIFVNSMSDLFHKDVPDEFIAKVWQVMGMAPKHDYQILTKRHGRMRSWVTRWYSGEIPEPYDVRPVPGFPGYSVTTRGEILGKRNDTLGGMKQERGEHGHCRIRLHRKGSPRSGEALLVHRLVLAAFVRPAAQQEEVRHLNGHPTDNRLSNLQWSNRQENLADRIRHGTGQSCTKLNEADVVAIRERSRAGESAYRIARDYPVSDTQIQNVVTGKHWSLPVRSKPQPGARAVLDCVHLGVSVENQKAADLRIPALLGTPAAGRWISAEPLLGPVDLLGDVERPGPAVVRTGFATRTDYGTGVEYDCDDQVGIDWLVCGGESGRNARPMDLRWARDLRDQCAAAGVPYFFKQLGTPLAKAIGVAGKGERLADIPEDLRIRQMPEEAL